MPMVDTDDLVSNTEIARLAEVTPAAVSNWKSRFDDFPKPVITFSNGHFQIYRWSEVREWLTTPRTVTYTQPARIVTRTLPARFQREEDHQ